MNRKNEKMKIENLIVLGKYMALPYFIGWCIPTFSRYTENYNFKKDSVLTKYLEIPKDQEFAYVYKNFQYMMSFKKLICILFVGIISYMIEKRYWKNSENIKNKYIKGLKILSIFSFFYIGMRDSETWILVLPLLLYLYLYFKIEISIKFKELKLIIEQKKLKKYLEKIFMKQEINIDRPIQKKELIQSRSHKKVLLLNALKTSERILVDAVWGTGKTTFVDIVLDDASSSYHKIKIDILVFNNREKIKNEFLNQIKSILKEEKIYFKNMNEYLGFINNIGSIWSNVIKDTFYENDSFESAKESLKKDLGLLKKIL